MLAHHGAITETAEPDQGRGRRGELQDIASGPQFRRFQTLIETAGLRHYFIPFTTTPALLERTATETRARLNPKTISASASTTRPSICAGVNVMRFTASSARWSSPNPKPCWILI